MPYFTFVNEDYFYRSSRYNVDFCVARLGTQKINVTRLVRKFKGWGIPIYNTQSEFHADDFQRRIMWVEVAPKHIRKSNETGKIFTTQCTIVREAISSEIDLIRSVMCHDPNLAYHFACIVDQKSHNRTREAVLTSNEYALRYARDVDKYLHPDIASVLKNTNYNLSCFDQTCAPQINTGKSISVEQIKTFIELMKQNIEDDMVYMRSLPLSSARDVIEAEVAGQSKIVRYLSRFIECEEQNKNGYWQTQIQQWNEAYNG